MKKFDSEILKQIEDCASPDALGLRIFDLPRLRSRLADLLGLSVSLTENKKLELIRVLRDLCETLLIVPARFPEGFKEIPAWDLSLDSEENLLEYIRGCNSKQISLPAFLMSKDSAHNLCLRIYSLALRWEIRGPIFLYHPQPGPMAAELGLYNSTADWIKVVNGKGATKEGVSPEALLQSEWTRSKVLGSTLPRS